MGEAQLDQVTQQDAALVEESAAGADSLKQQAANLTQVVGVFKLSHDAQASQAAALHHGAMRRGPHRATNVTRPKFGTKSAAPRRAASPASSAPAAPAAKTGTATTGKPSRSSG